MGALLPYGDLPIRLLSSSDGVHLTKTGNAEFSRWLVSQLSDVLDEIFKDPDIDDCSTSSQCEDPVFTTTVDVPDGPIGFKSNDTDSVRKIQSFLAEYNFRPGPIDGDFGTFNQLVNITTSTSI